jgi:hypothetical protein
MVCGRCDAAGTCTLACLLLSLHSLQLSLHVFSPLCGGNASLLGGICPGAFTNGIGMGALYGVGRIASNDRLVAFMNGRLWGIWQPLSCTNFKLRVNSRHLRYIFHRG